MAKTKPAKPAAEPALDLTTKVGQEAFAGAVVEQLDQGETVELDDLAGSPLLLDMLAELPLGVRDAYGFSFEVLVNDQGPEAYLPDSKWGRTPPTREAVAQRYGPGRYTVIVKARRTRKGGGWGAPIQFTIAPPRSPNQPAAASGVNDQRVWDLLQRVLTRNERAADQRVEDLASTANVGGIQLDEATLEKIGEAFAKKSTDGINIPDFLKPALERLLLKFVDGDDAPAATGGPTS